MFVRGDAVSDESAAQIAEARLREHRHHGRRLLAVDGAAEVLHLVGDRLDRGKAGLRPVRLVERTVREAAKEAAVFAEDVLLAPDDAVVGGTVHVGCKLAARATRRAVEGLKLQRAGGEVPGNRRLLAALRGDQRLFDRAASLFQQGQHAFRTFRRILRLDVGATADLGIPALEQRSDRAERLCSGLREAYLHERLHRELPLGHKCGKLVKVLHDAGKDNAFVDGGDLVRRTPEDRQTRNGDIRHERERRVDHRIKCGALRGRDVRHRLGEGPAETTSEKARGGVVLHSEDLFRILLGEIERGVAGDFLKNELFHAALRIGLEIRIIGVENGLRHAFLVVLPGRVERRLGRGVPGCKAVEQAQPLAEVRRAFEEASAVAHEPVRLGAGRRERFERFELGAVVHLGVEVGGAREGAVVHLGVEVGGAREARQLRLRVALRKHSRLVRGIVDRLEPNRRGTRLGGAVRVDCGLDGEYAAGGKGLALVVVLHQHRLLDGLGDPVLPAEHVDDRRPEDRARAVVHVAFIARAQPLVDLVRFHVGDGKDFFAVEFLDARVGDRLLLVLAGPILREVHEGLERTVVSVDVEGHCFSPSCSPYLPCLHEIRPKVTCHLSASLAC